MPTFAGYIMTPEHMLEWIRTQYPNLPVDENCIPFGPFYELYKKHNMYKVFRFEHLALPGPPNTDGPPGQLNPKRIAIMFIRRSCPGDRKIWMPQREIPGVASDSKAGKFLKKLGLVTTDWVVLHVPADDMLRSSWVLEPKKASDGPGAISQCRNCSKPLEGSLLPQPHWPNWSFALVPATFVLASYLVLKRTGKGVLALSLNAD
ncbi:unnamed protein product [Rhizoctonia solani]|uniref:Uncharacterized protein n=1 Tax=Rhizoctonia solani TaxID=456999 RepID=A0A8H3DEM7_9AGAM|nr:unnamed protein product [Rhizoctonia solani]